MQWQNPSDILSLLLLIGGDVVQRAQAQQAADPLFPTPVPFSFGWLAYTFTSLLAIAGDNRLMPNPDISCIVVNAETGYQTQNASWVISRLLRDFELFWMPTSYREKLDRVLKDAGRPKAGVCVSIFRASSSRKAGDPPKRDPYWWSGYAIALTQLGIAAIPWALFGDWVVFAITAGGTILAFASGSLPQWSHELYFGRKNTRKTFIITRGNGAQHALIIMGDGHGLDLGDLASSNEGVTLTSTRVIMPILTILWVALLITVSGIHENTWFLILIGSIGMVHTAIIAAVPRNAHCYGIHLDPVECIVQKKVMAVLQEVEGKYPGVGRSILPIFFPGELRQNEDEYWTRARQLESDAKRRAKDEKSQVGYTQDNRPSLLSGEK